MFVGSHIKTNYPNMCTYLVAAKARKKTETSKQRMMRGVELRRTPDRVEEDDGTSEESLSLCKRH